MDQSQFVRSQNVERYRRLLERVTEESDRRTITKLLAEELGRAPRSRPAQKKSPSRGLGGSGSWAFDLRDKNSSRDRRYNDRPANWFAYPTN
jgi:hypothetical protein